MIMKSIIIQIIILFNCQILSSQNDIAGILIDPEIAVEYNKGSEAIVNSIMMNISNLNLLEYSYALPELYDLLNKGKITEEQWKKYITTLNETINNKDSLKPIFVGQDKELIQLQYEFFLSTIEKNVRLKEKYSDEYTLLKKYRVTINNDNCKRNIQELITISDVVGETNFWFYLQVEGCQLLSEVGKNEQLLNKAISRAEGLLIVSNCKTPYYLQLRKLKDLQYRLTESKVPLCIDFSILLNKRIIAIKDKDTTFFEEYPNWDNIREF